MAPFVQVPGNADAGRLTTDHSVGQRLLVRRVARPADAGRRPDARRYLLRLQPLARAARSPSVQLEALPVDLDHVGRAVAGALRYLVRLVRARLVQVRDDTRAAAHPIVRDAVQRRAGGKVKDDHLVQAARSLRTDAVARFLLRKVQPALFARIGRAHVRLGYERTELARPLRVELVAVAVLPLDVPVLAAALRLQPAARPVRVTLAVRDDERVPERARPYRAQLVALVGFVVVVGQPLVAGALARGKEQLTRTEAGPFGEKLMASFGILVEVVAQIALIFALLLLLC